MAMIPDLPADMVKDGATRPSGLLPEISRLQSTLEVIRSVVCDAERRRMDDKAINLWVKELKDVMYDADDVLDIFNVAFHKQKPLLEHPKIGDISDRLEEILQRRAKYDLEAVDPNVQGSIVSRRFLFVKKIGDLNDRLEEILQRRAKYDLEAVDPKVQDSIVSHRTSPILSSDVVGVGIDEDAREMIGRLLLKENRPRPGNLIFAITGMGGIGKTTLAQKIYNDSTIKEHFEFRFWVFVSRHFSETDLLRGIISVILDQRKKTSPYKAHTRQQLEEMVFKIIEGKRFLLVLDDVWSTEAWEHVLRNPFQSGAPGSRIIVTTRNKDVAKRMGAVHLHQVRPLSDEDSWSLLFKTVFMGEDEIDIDWLRDIGLKIVNKCGGLPLALKFAGETLRTKERIQSEWEKVLKSLTSFSTRFNEEFMGALYLSYQALPSHLQPCFVYCSLFPENRVMARRDLVQLWIAEGFVKSHPRLALEEVAEDYYSEIAASSLLQLETDHMDEGCRMHDVIRDLAFILAEDDSYAGDLGRLQETQTRPRRLAIASSEAIPVTNFITQMKNLRALLIFGNPLTDSMLRDLVDQLGHLRVLDLRGAAIVEVPSSIENLFHLRYLNLSCTRIRGLPNSIKELQYLQFLNLNGCTDLQHLPTGITELHNLRSLDLLYTAVDQIPSGVGKLEHLNTLLGYVVSDGLQALKSLNRLRDLNIRKLERAEVEHVAPLQDKPHLRSLVLSCQDGYDPADDAASMRIANILDDLRPPLCLEQLTIECYFGTEYPRWMFSPSDYTNLVRLNLKSCTFCTRLPPLGQLPQLKYLRISASSAILSIGAEFFGDSGHSFPKLERLVIQDMPNWVKCQGPEDDALPLLRQMHLNKCPKLSSLPRCLQNSTSLTELVIEAADSIRAIEGLASVTQLRLEDCPNLERISCLPALNTLQIIKCPLLEDVCDVEALHHLELVDFALESLPGWLEPDKLTTLHTLDITGNRDLLNGLQKDGSEWHKVANIPHLYAHSADRSTYFAYTKGIFSFNNKLGETTKRYGRALSYGGSAHLDTK